MKSKWGLIFILTAFLAIGSNAFGAPFIINDNPTAANTYWGGVSGPAQDVLGGDDYDIDRMEISFSGTVMTVKMIGAFFAKYGTGSGDLYLNSKGYQVSGMGPHHIGDYFNKDEGWDYVISASAPNGVYTLSFPSIIETTSGRVAQAFQDGYGIKVPDVTVASSLIGDTYTLMFDTAKLDLGPTFGVHFTMSCGNDIIEGEVPMVPAPEPSTICLFASGFIGFVIKMRKKLF